MTDFIESCIYRITTKDEDGNEYDYIGSTKNFDKRKTGHKENIYQQRSDKYNLKLYKKIRENGGNWEMKKYKDFPCKNRTELRHEEQQVINQFAPTLNSYRAYTTAEEEDADDKKRRKAYYLENKEKINMQRKKNYEANREVEQKKQKIYRDQHKPEMKEYNKIYRKENEAELKKQKKKWYQKNRDLELKKGAIYRQENRVKLKEKITCDCGCVIARQQLGRHKKTQKHLNLMESLELDE